MKTQLYQWLKTNRVMLVNAGSLVCTTLVTGVMGFAYWWVAARQFHPDAVGLASAAVSAMMLLGAISVLGLGTLLIGELPRQPGKEASLISTALILVAVVGGLVGILFAALAPFISADLRPLGANIGSVLLFAAGVSFTSITIVLDQALIGLLRGELQFWRNALFAATKLVAVIVIGLGLHFLLFHKSGEAIYATWAMGNAISLLPFAAFVLIKKSSSLRHIMPDWSLLRKLGFSALQHHMLNLIQQVPTTALPVLVTILLSATKNAWFYIAWMISGFVFTAAYALTTVLYAINAAEPEELARKMRLTLNLAFITSLGANIFIQIDASQILDLFGHTYAVQAAWSLRIVSLAAFPMIIKFHYIAVSRIDKKLLRALLPVASGSLIELGAAAIGAHLGDLVGLSLGWTIAVGIEAVFMAPAVFKALRFHPSIETQTDISLADTLSLETQLGSAISSTSAEWKELQLAGSSATSKYNGIVETPTPLNALLSDDDMEETQLGPKMSRSLMYQLARTQPLPAIPAELEMQKLLSISASITGKYQRVKLPSSLEQLASPTDQHAKLQRLPNVSTSIADPLVATQQLPKTPPPITDEQDETQTLPKISALVLEKKREISALPDASSELCCVQCHAALPKHAKFCSGCGQQINEINLDQKQPISSDEPLEVDQEQPVSPNASVEVLQGQPVSPDEPLEADQEQPDRSDEPVEVLQEQPGGPDRPVEIYEKRSAASIISVIATVALPFCALLVWFTVLPTISMHVRDMTDLGLVSILPPATILAPFLLSISFCLAMWQKKEKTPIILLHLLILIFMLYGITALVETVPRFAIVYRHEGYTEYIMRRGNVDPSLDAYFDWPGFFIFSAFLTKIAGYSSILSYAAWSPFFLNLIYFFPLYVIFTSATTDKRIIWFGIWFFYLTNWIAQDYFSPQGLNFFLYLVIIAILLKWFKVPARDQERRTQGRWQRFIHRIPFGQRVYAWLTAPDPYTTPSSPRQRAALLVCLIAIFGFMIFSHPLTPFFTIPGVMALIIFQRCKPVWLPFLMIAMTAGWVITMAQPYLASNLNNVIGDFAHINRVVSQNVTDRATQGDIQHNFISDIRLLMTAFIWGLALIGGIIRLRKGYRDASYVLLALAPFPVILLQSYGGEMLLRIYLFTLPMMTFFAAAIFFTPSSQKKALFLKGGVLVTCFVLLGAFFFTRYGNERMDYITPEELAGVQHLYAIAPPNSLFLEPWDGAPLQLQDYEIFNTDSLGEDMPNAVINGNLNAIIQHIRDQNSSRTYMIITRTERATSVGDGIPPGTLDRLEKEMLRSKTFVQIYANRDAQIFLFVDQPGSSSH